MNLEDKKWGKYLMYVATLCGALFGIFKFGEYSLEKLEVYQATQYEKIELIVIDVVKNNDDLLLVKIIEELDDRYDDGPRIDSLMASFNDKFKYYSVGFRSDGSGKLWYRTAHNEMYRAYHNLQHGWYYIKDDGEIIIIQ